MHEERGVNRTQKKHQFHILTQMGRKMTTEELQSSHQLLTGAVAFMIDHAPRLFDTSKPPPQLLKDITGNRTPSNFNVNRASESISQKTVRLEVDICMLEQSSTFNSNLSCANRICLFEINKFKVVLF